VLKYISTRGQAPRLSFAETTLAGLASDGGLYVPEACPKIEPGEIGNMGNQNYLEIAWRVMLPFVSEDLTSEELMAILKASYKKFDTKDVAPLRQLEDNLHVLELFHGPTLAFKDVALQFLGNVFEHFLKKRAQKVTIVGATSGDTGSAAIEAFRGKPNVNIFIFHPHKRVSEVQRRQMTTVQDSNVFNVAIEGSFDDCQDLVKEMFNDAKFRAEMGLSAINSINWARILAQVVYYIYAGARLHDETGKEVTFSVPTGNFGNVYAGYIAQSMGLPVEKLLVATNRNDILHRFFVSGSMKMEGVTPTISPSMDIQISSNFERLLFDIYGRMPKAVEQTMAHFRKSGPFRLEPQVMEGVRKLFASGRVDDAQTIEVIRRTYQKYDYAVDPHTAVGLGVAQAWLKDNPNSAVISLATAHPAKFPDAVKRAIGVEPVLPEHLADLFSRPEKYDVMTNDLAKVQDFVRRGVKAAA
jgi:threonine synthase